MEYETKYIKISELPKPYVHATAKSQLFICDHET